MSHHGPNFVTIFIVVKLVHLHFGVGKGKTMKTMLGPVLVGCPRPLTVIDGIGYRDDEALGAEFTA